MKSWLAFLSLIGVVENIYRTGVAQSV